MPIYLRPDIVQDMIKQRFGTIDELAADWEERVVSNRNFPKARQRASMYRWVKDGVPSRGDQIIGLCAMLDVDPMAIFDYEKNGYFSQFASIRHKIQLGLAHVGVFSPLYRVYKPGPEWPSDETAQTCYERPWFGVEFNNADHWSETNYSLVKVKFARPSNDPRAVHIAYRRTDSADTMWRYFGTVLSVAGELRLYSESGAYQTMPEVELGEVRFRTFYGGRPVEFRVASLHEFSLDTEYPHNDKATIGFEW